MCVRYSSWTFKEINPLGPWYHNALGILISIWDGNFQRVKECSQSHAPRWSWDLNPCGYGSRAQSWPLAVPHSCCHFLYHISFTSLFLPRPVCDHVPVQVQEWKIIRCWRQFKSKDFGVTQTLLPVSFGQLFNMSSPRCKIKTSTLAWWNI